MLRFTGSGRRHWLPGAFTAPGFGTMLLPGTKYGSVFRNRTKVLMDARVSLTGVGPSRWLLAVTIGLLATLILTGAVPAQEPVRLLAFGDSLTHGYGLPQGDTFPEQLEAALAAEGRAVTVLNGGNSGDTTAAGLARLDWALADQPDAVIVELGANDGLRGIDPGDTRRNLDAILAKLTAQGLPVLLAGMLAPRNLGPEYAGAFDSVFPDLAEKYDVALYPFFLDGVALEPELNQPDGIHPNREGVSVIVERILPSVLALLDQVAAERGAAETGADG